MLILADEPTGNLAPRTGAEVVALFQELHEAGKTKRVGNRKERITSATVRFPETAARCAAVFSYPH